MNIFALDYDPIQAAIWLVDSHCVKMPLESAQMLANCFKPEMLESLDCPRTQNNNIRKHSFVKHPCSIWVRETRGNMRWLIRHALTIDDERMLRFANDRPHFCRFFIEWCEQNIAKASLVSNSEELTPFAQAMPKQFMHQDSVIAYRQYYQLGKAHLHSWRLLEHKPIWICESKTTF